MSLTRLAAALSAALCITGLRAVLAEAVSDPASAAAQDIKGLNLVGPPLTALPTKISDPRWLMAWLLKPSRLRPGTLMPDFDPAPEETQSIAAYLFAQDAPKTAEVKWQNGDPARGEKLFVARGCRACHAVAPNEKSVSPRVPNLAGIGLKAKAGWLFNWLKAPRAYSPHTAMPQLALSDDDIRHLVAFLLSRRDGAEIVETAPHRDPKGRAEAGRIVIERYECFTCHEVRGFPAPRPAVEVAADAATSSEESLQQGRLLIAHYNCRGCHHIEGSGGLIGEYLERKSFAPPTLEGEGARVQTSWLTQFLQHPTMLRPWLDMHMPNFGLSEAEARVLAKYFAVTASAPATDEEHQADPPETLARGLRRIAHFKCTQCHPSGTQPPEDVDPENLSINLTLAKSRLRPSWVRRFLAHPKAIVGTQTRMPDIFFTIDGIPKVEHPDDDIAVISAYLVEMPQPLDAALAALEQRRKAEQKDAVDWTQYQY